MKLCQNCGQSVAEEITTCPSCGGEIGEGRQSIDDYQIEEVLHEGHASILCRAVKRGEEKPVMIRLFTRQSAVNEVVAERLKRELQELKKLPAAGFVSHQEINRSSDGLWYRVSEWVEAESWGVLARSGWLNDYRVAFQLFSRIASILEVLHRTGHFIPHLILNDIMVIRGEDGRFDVKIDYKLSRFLDPKLDRPPPMLKHLLACHPDIVNQRALDFRSDIWSLGKIFVEILTADYETCDYLAKVDQLPLPRAVAVLLKTMLAEDPDLRPRSMSEVAETLSRVTEEEIEKARRRRRELVAISAAAIRGLKKRHRVLAALVALLIVAGGLAWFQLVFRKEGAEAVLEQYANQYAPSVAFVLVEYWVGVNNSIVYRNRAEGTAFLADSDGYLLTNRHVASPWLEDAAFHAVVNELKQSDRSPRFDFRMFLWFEGAKAFNRTAGLIESPDLSDAYFLGSAFRTDATPRLHIAGVAKPPVQTRQLILSPLRDDFAVLKVDRVPEGLEPLPLDLKMKTRAVPRLSRVITLGFPLGSRTQESSVNVAVAWGHVRRSFEDLLQVDVSIYGGNSGGPLIDTRGKVIGIISGVATDRAPGLLQVVTPLWNMAMVLPIPKAGAFLEELKAGRVKWSGILDLSVESKVKRITEKAAQGKWAEAMRLADEELQRSLDPSLVMAAGMMHFCAGDKQGARQLFDQSLSMDGENHLARLMLFMIDWLADRSSLNPQRKELLAMDWRSPAEFLGYLVQVLEGLVEEESALKDWDTESEESWLRYIVALIRTKRGEWDEAERLLRQAVLAADTDAWEYFLARAKLEEVQRTRLVSLKAHDRWSAYQADVEAFWQAVQVKNVTKEIRRAKFKELQAVLQRESASPEDKREALEEVLAIAPSNGEARAALTFYSAMDEEWEQSLDYARAYLNRNGRENANRLSIGLFEAEILHRMGRDEDAWASLEAYSRRTRDAWYRAIGESLMGKRTEDSLTQAMGESPENLITLHTALGFWAEGSGDNQGALQHYKQALESFLDTWLQFSFARERIKRLRQVSD